MASNDTGSLVFAGASISINPTDLLNGSAPAWGGTALSLAKNVVVKISRKVKFIREEPFGPMPFTGIDLGESVAVVGGFRTYDPDVVQKVFASTGTGASTGARQIVYPNGNTYRTGGLISDLGIKLLITPDDVDNQRFFYLYNAVPLLEEDAQLPFQRDEEWVIPFRFIGLPDASNRTYAYGFREDLNSIL